MARQIALLVVLAALLLAGARAQASAAGGGTAPNPREPGNYVLRVEDGTVTRLGGPETIVALAPDGALAAVETRRGPNSSIRIVDTATGREAGSISGAALEPVWSPDGQRLAILVPGAAGGPFELRMIDPRTGDTVGVLRDPLDWWIWAPDGRAITGVRHTPSGDGFVRSIVSVDVAAGNVVDTILEPSASICPGELAWSPDGRRLLFRSGGAQNPCGTEDADGLWLWDAGTRQRRQLTRGALYEAPRWTADGWMLARTLNPDSTNEAASEDIVLIGLDGATRVLATAPTKPLTFPYGPYLATAGPNVAFGSLDGCGEGELSVVALAGGAPRRLSPPGVTIADALLRPDGLGVAWAAGRPQARDLQLAATDGSGIRTLLTGLPQLLLYGWSKDGRLLAFGVGMPAALECS